MYYKTVKIWNFNWYCSDPHMNEELSFSHLRSEKKNIVLIVLKIAKVLRLKMDSNKKNRTILLWIRSQNPPIKEITWTIYQKEKQPKVHIFQ